MPPLTAVLSSSADASVESLLRLTPNQLMALSPPLVVDPVLRAIMRRIRNVLFFSHQKRFQLLAAQELAWADDVIWRHLQKSPLMPKLQPQ